MNFKNKQNTSIIIRIRKIITQQSGDWLGEGPSGFSGMSEMLFFFVGIMLSQVYIKAQLITFLKYMHLSAYKITSVPVKNPPEMKEMWRCGFNPWVRKISWRRKWQPTPVFLPGKSHGQRSLAGYSPRVTMLDMTELLNSNKLVNTYIFVWYL